MSEQNLERRAVVEQLLQGRTDLSVVTGLGSSTYDVAAAGEHPRNFYLWGAMGSAVTVGLGLANAQPALPVVVITGDGEQLMGMGALATCSIQKPSNLTIVVLDNGHYGETGMQQSHSGLGISLAEIAKACGFPFTTQIQDTHDLAALRDRIHQPKSLGFATINISAADTPRVLPSRDGVLNKHNFRQALGHSPSH